VSDGRGALGGCSVYKEKRRDDARVGVAGRNNITFCHTRRLVKQWQRSVQPRLVHARLWRSSSLPRSRVAAAPPCTELEAGAMGAAWAQACWLRPVRLGRTGPHAAIPYQWVPDESMVEAALAEIGRHRAPQLSGFCQSAWQTPRRHLLISTCVSSGVYTHETCKTCDSCCWPQPANHDCRPP